MPENTEEKQPVESNPADFSDFLKQPGGAGVSPAPASAPEQGMPASSLGRAKEAFLAWSQEHKTLVPIVVVVLVVAVVALFFYFLSGVVGGRPATGPDPLTPFPPQAVSPR